MKKQTSILKNTILVFSFILVGFMLVASLGFKRDSPMVESIVYIDNADVSINGETPQNVKLPYTIKNMEPSTPVTLKTTITPSANGSVFVQVNYTYADVFLNEKKVFTFGKKQNYPFFMMTPAKEIHAIETYGNGEEMELRIEYLTSQTGDDLVLEVPMVGTAKELILERSMRYGFAWTLSMTQILGGIALLLISIGLLFIDKKGVLFTWLGLFSLTSGAWFFGSNLFAITVFPTTTWLYTSSNLGFMFCMITLLRFIQTAVDFEEKNPIIILEILFSVSIITAILLQLFGVYPLHKSWSFFSFVIPVSLLFLTVYIIRERIHFKNRDAGRFIIPTIILTICATLGMVNAQFSKNVLPISIFQIGVILFMLIIGMLAGAIVKNSINLKKREEKLEVKRKILNIQTEEQKENSLLIAKNEQEISRQRHDLRHHLTAIRELATDNEPLQKYIDVLIKKIPASKEHYCENSVVDAIVSHYATICENSGIKLSIKLVVPNTDSRSMDGNLCVIFANLLENAVEACDRMTDGEKFIELNSTIQNRLLTITMNNSFNGHTKKVGERFLSSKRDEFGIGLDSIKTIARDYHGGTDFHSEDRVFLSSVYLVI